MTPIAYLDGSSTETERAQLCRRKAIECQRAALTTANPEIRLGLSNLAKLWRAMAGEAARETHSSVSEERGGVVFLNRFRKLE